MHNFKELKVWQISRRLVKEVYETTSTFPATEKYGLISQVRRCAISIPTNIAEGCGRGTNPQFSHFLDISLGSACELETQVVIAQKLKFINENDARTWIELLHSEQKHIRSFRDKISTGLL